MSKYLVKLTPLDTFFFSKENKYRKKKEKGKTKYEADYYQESAYFPQQTTLLGMLRYYILMINNQIPIADTDTAAKLVGDKSFSINGTNNFKLIKNLSAVFIVDNENKFYFENPKDLIIKDKKVEKLNTIQAPFKTNLSNDALFVNNYKEKEGLSKFLLNSENDILPFDYDKEKEPKGIFIRKEKIGITKSKSGKTLNNAFYKQVVYSLAKGYSFGFIAEIEDEIKDGFVEMGAEKNPFAISFSKFEKNIEKCINLPDNNAPKIVLLSDAYLSNYNSNDFSFAISNTKTFRFLKTEVQKGNEYYSSNPLDNNTRKITRSKKFNLFERGSVFYFKDQSQLDDFSNKLNKEVNFKQIGYNQHLKIYKL